MTRPERGWFRRGDGAPPAANPGLPANAGLPANPGLAGEIGDGGFTDWTARLLNNAKERCLISCVATERLAAVVAAVSR